MKVELIVDDEPVVLTEYPAKVLFEVVAGFMRTLHGIEPESWKHAVIELER